MPSRVIEAATPGPLAPGSTMSQIDYASILYGQNSTFIAELSADLTLGSLK